MTSWNLGNSRNCDVIPAVIITSISALSLYYVTWDNQRKNAYGQFHVIFRIVLHVITAPVNSIILRKGSSGLN